MKTKIDENGNEVEYFDSVEFEQDLFKTDTFSFGTKIGQITNTCSTICGLLPEFDKNSKEFETLCNRLKAGCAAQSRQMNLSSAYRVICMKQDGEPVNTGCHENG